MPTQNTFFHTNRKSKTTVIQNKNAYVNSEQPTFTSIFQFAENYFNNHKYKGNTYLKIYNKNWRNFPNWINWRKFHKTCNMINFPWRQKYIDTKRMKCCIVCSVFFLFIPVKELCQADTSTNHNRYTRIKEPKSVKKSKVC